MVSEYSVCGVRIFGPKKNLGRRWIAGHPDRLDRRVRVIQREIRSMKETDF